MTTYLLDEKTDGALYYTKITDKRITQYVKFKNDKKSYCIGPHYLTDLYTRDGLNPSGLDELKYDLKTCKDKLTQFDIEMF